MPRLKDPAFNGGIFPFFCLPQKGICGIVIRMPHRPAGRLSAGARKQIRAAVCGAGMGRSAGIHVQYKGGCGFWIPKLI